MDFGGGGGSPPPIQQVDPTRPVETTPEELARQVAASRKKRRGVRDLIIDPSTNAPDTSAINTGRP